MTTHLVTKADLDRHEASSSLYPLGVNAYTLTTEDTELEHRELP